MRILNVQEFIKDQYGNYRERRTSQFMRFLDKNVDFVTYYSINKNLSTYSHGNHEIDSYIGTDSPVRYNKVFNMPVYGFPIINDEVTYDEEHGGFNVEGYNGEIIILPGIMEPCEGDCFVLDIFNEHIYFQVTEVTNISLKSKPHFKVSFKFGTPDYLDQLNKQVVETYNAIFDNIGTQDRVIISNDEFTRLDQYIKIYDEMLNYYVATYFKPKTTTFELKVKPYSTSCVESKYTDKFLMRFMETNRIIILDLLMKSSLILDYNALYSSEDHLEYKKSIYWAIENKDMRYMIPAHHVTLKKLISPFTLLHGQTKEEYYTSTKFVIDEPTDNLFFIDYDFEEIVTKWKGKNFTINDTEYSRLLSIIIKYLCDKLIMPGYFADLMGVLEPMQEYMMLPIILFIIRAQINGLTKRPTTVTNNSQGGVTKCSQGL